MNNKMMGGNNDINRILFGNLSADECPYYGRVNLAFLQLRGESLPTHGLVKLLYDKMKSSKALYSNLSVFELKDVIRYIAKEYGVRL